jgi:hypothetical protein
LGLESFEEDAGTGAATGAATGAEEEGAFFAIVVVVYIIM